MPRTLWFEHLWTPAGWQSPGSLAVDDAGCITAAGGDAASAPVAASYHGFAVPGLPNLHSHAFQRAFAGHAERRAPHGVEASFWSWREVNYGFAAQVDPDQLEAVAALLQMELLEAGFTAVAEFHYLHHGPDGQRYADLGETGQRVLAAAATTGIRTTLLPVLYRRGGFDRPLRNEQLRFGCRDLDEFVALFESLRPAAARGGARLGIAPHSLRAVSGDELRDAVSWVRAVDPQAPVHIHVAEQRAEVGQCVAATGMRPVQWVLAHLPVDDGFCLVHATHADATERRALAASGAVAGLCPTTEANLGDGLFGAVDYLRAGGCFGIGTDSHVGVDPAEELRLLEYGQRLHHERRTLLAAPEQSVAERLFAGALSGGARALRQPIGEFAVGRFADVVVLDADHPRLLGHGPGSALDAWLFSTNGRSPVRDVLLGGEAVVTAGRHRARDAVIDAYRRTVVD